MVLPGKGSLGASHRPSTPESRVGSRGYTYKVKFVIKAVLGSSTSKDTSLAVSARLTALVVTTLWAKREVTLQLILVL